MVHYARWLSGNRNRHLPRETGFGAQSGGERWQAQVSFKAKTALSDIFEAI